MRTPSRMHLAGVIACLSAVLVAAACGSDDASSSPTASTVTVTQSSAQSSSTPPETVTPTDSGSIRNAPTQTSPEEKAQPVFQKYPEDANVNARNFYGPGAGVKGYFFQSPSGNVRCGIHFDNPNLPSGCQALVSAPGTSGLTCRNDPGSEYSVQLAGDVALSRCVNQPFFVGGSGNPGDGVVGGRVLKYGEIISSGGTTCESTTFGISCWGASSVGFTLSREYNTHYGEGAN